RLDIPFDGIRDLAVDEGTLVVKTQDQEARFVLGAPLAERWLRLIKEPKGLLEKLEITPQSRVSLVDVQESTFLLALRECAASVTSGRVPQGAPVIFFGAESKDALRKMMMLRGRMREDG